MLAPNPPQQVPFLNPAEQAAVDLIDSLTRRVRELEDENARLKEERDGSH